MKTTGYGDDKLQKFSIYGMRNSRFSTFNQQQQQRNDKNSPIVSTVHVNCLQTVNLLFVEVTYLGHQNQKH